MRDEVETLLRHEDAAAQFIESPSLLAAAARRDDSAGDGRLSGRDLGPVRRAHADRLRRHGRRLSRQGYAPGA